MQKTRNMQSNCFLQPINDNRRADAASQPSAQWKWVGDNWGLQKPERAGQKSAFTPDSVFIQKFFDWFTQPCTEDISLFQVFLELFARYLFLIKDN